MGEARMRKLSALAFCNLLSTTNPVILQRMPVLMGAITMVLPDVESERGYEYVLSLPFLTLLLKAFQSNFVVLGGSSSAASALIQRKETVLALSFPSYMS